MSLITSCPACGTMFRVVPDQLKISEGWVRCGHCSEVFDATAHLADDPGPAAEAAEAARTTQSAPLDTGMPGLEGWLTTSAASLHAPMPPDGLPADAAPAPAPGAPAARTPAARPAAAAMPVAPAEPPPARRGLDSQAPEATELDAPFVFRRSDLLDGDPVPSVLPPRPDSRLPQHDEPPPPLADVSFVRQARRRAVWHRPPARIFLTLVSLALAAALLLQFAWHDRDRLALVQPQLRPALEQMCGYLGCTLGPPRQIESVVIESSGFNRLRNEAYRLTFALRNTAAIPVAAPAMELTLTDPQDQPLVRRVLTPAELGARDGMIAAGAEWSGAVGIVVTAVGGPRVAGYRLLAFYP